MTPDDPSSYTGALSGAYSCICGDKTVGLQRRPAWQPRDQVKVSEWYLWVPERKI